jgi:hypothetical protein
MTGGWRAGALATAATAAGVALAALPAAAQAGASLTWYSFPANDGSVAYDYSAVLDGPNAVAFVGSAGSAGGVETLLGAAANDVIVFSRANVLFDVDPASPTQRGPGTTMGLQVDGVNAFTGATWQLAGGDRVPFTAYAGVPAVDASTVELDGGVARAVEHDTVRVCSAHDPTYYPLAGFTCAEIADVGVAIDVTSTESANGDVLRREWSIRSTDGRAHTVRLVLHDGAYGGAAARAWKLPGDNGYARRATGDVVAVPPAGPFTLEMRSAANNAPNGADPATGLGAITYGTAPSSLRFLNAHELVGTYVVNVPAGGAAPLTFVLATEGDQPSLDAAVSAAEASLGGGASGPGGGGGGDAPGGGTPGGGTPGGESPGVGSGPVSSPGGGHDTGTPPRKPAPAAPLPTIVRSGKAHVANGTLALGYAASCSRSGPACTVGIALTTKGKAKRGHRPTLVTLARGSVRVAAGRRAPLRVKTKRSARALRRAKPTVTLTLKRGAAKPRTAAKRLRW